MGFSLLFSKEWYINIPSLINISLCMKIGTIRLEKHPVLCTTHSVVLQLMKTLLYVDY
jgi:hypothetical protein